MARGISLEGLHVQRVTYKAHASLTAADEGKAVALVADSTVGLGTNGAPLEGKLVKLENGYCTVEVSGYIELPYLTTPPTVESKVVVDGAGNVKDYAVDTIANAVKGRGAVKSIDSTNAKVIVKL